MAARGKFAELPAALRGASPRCQCSSLAMLPPPGVPTYPTYSDAVIQTCVQHALEALVQPRLDCLADKVAGQLSHAHSELRELERVVERAEARTDGRLSTMESRVAVMADAAARTEQRERDLNARIAGLAEGLLLERRGEGGRLGHGLGGGLGGSLGGRGEPGMAPEVFNAKLAELERHVEARLQVVEESVKRGAKSVWRFEATLQELEERNKVASRVNDKLRELCEDTGRRDFVGHEGGDGRLASLEERVENLSAAVNEIGPLATVVGQLDACVDAQQRKVEAVCTDVAECFRDAKAACTELAERRRDTKEQSWIRDEWREESRRLAEGQQSMAARVDDLHCKVGALRVKADGLEGRVGSLAERATEALTRRSSETPFHQQLLDDAGRLVAEVEPRVAVLEQQLHSLSDTCEDLVEQALERRLEQLGGGGRKTPKGSRGRGAEGTSSRPSPSSGTAYMANSQGYIVTEESDEEDDDLLSG